MNRPMPPKACTAASVIATGEAPLETTTSGKDAVCATTVPWRGQGTNAAPAPARINFSTSLRVSGDMLYFPQR